MFDSDSENDFEASGLEDGEQEVAHLRFGNVSLRVDIDGHYTRKRGVQVPTPPTPVLVQGTVEELEERLRQLSQVEVDRLSNKLEEKHRGADQEKRNTAGGRRKPPSWRPMPEAWKEQ